jgi:hypothetical protein
MSSGMRFALAAVLLVSWSTTAVASSPEFPICDANPEPGFLAVTEGRLGPGCPVRWIESEPVVGGIAFELHTSDGRLAGTGRVTTPDELAVPERRHECDGTIADTTRTVYAYTATFLTAQPGDQVWMINSSGSAFATATYDFDGGCPAFEFAVTECQVCAPEAAMGCADAGGGGGGFAFGLVALGLVALRRARR